MHSVMGVPGHPDAEFKIRELAKSFEMRTFHSYRNDSVDFY
jgi:hypothetical protein